MKSHQRYNTSELEQLLPSFSEEAAVGVFDQAGRFATLSDGESVIARILRGETVHLRLREWLDSRTSPVPGDADRTADKVAALDDERAPDRPGSGKDSGSGVGVPPLGYGVY